MFYKISPHLGLFYNYAISLGSLCIYYVITRCFRNKDMDDAIRISRAFNSRSKIVIQSSQLTWSPWGCKIIKIQLGWLVERAPGRRGPASPKAAAHQSKLDSDKFSQSRRPNRGLDGIMRLLEVFNYALHG